MEPFNKKGKVEYIGFALSPEKDADILARLDSVDSKQGYIRMLIWNDLVRRGIVQGPIEPVVIKKGPPRTTAGSPRNSIKLVNGGPDQPIIDYFNTCPSKIDYIRQVIRQDIDAGGTVADTVNSPSEIVNPAAVVSSVERVVSLLRLLANQDAAFSGPDTDKAIDSLTAWITNHTA